MAPEPTAQGQAPMTGARHGRPTPVSWRHATAGLLLIALLDVAFTWLLGLHRWHVGMLVMAGAGFALLSSFLVLGLFGRLVQPLRSGLAALDRLTHDYLRLMRELPTPCLCVEPSSGRILDANAAAERLYGYSSEDLRDRPLAALGAEVPGARHRAGWGPAAGRHRRRDGGWVDVQVFRTDIQLREGLRQLWVCVDTTLELRANELLCLQARTDPLTGLADRTRSCERLAQVLGEAAADTRHALFLVDIDQFRLINEARGHAVGDLFLREVAARLSTLCGDMHIVGRLGGDEFLLLSQPLETGVSEQLRAEAIRSMVARSSVCDGIDIIATCSVGYALHPQDASDAEGLLCAAETALEQAKRAGRNTAMHFQPRMRAEASRHSLMVQSLRRAMEQGELRLRYQPQFALQDGRLVGIEALSAWTASDGREIPAGEFIPAAERCGLIIDLGRWALEAALSQLQQWRLAGHDVPALAVNVSPSQLQSPGFAERVIGEVERLELAPGVLELEITETVALRIDREVQDRVRRLAEAGIGMVVDDFGRGYSSLSHFTRLPLRKIKIDASFVSNIERSHDKQAIVRSMLSMASALGIYTVAEGVERVAEASWLFEHGCDAVQGYLCARPGAPALLASWLRGTGIPGPDGPGAGLAAG